MSHLESGIVKNAVEDSRDHKSRRLMLILAIVAVLSLAIAGLALWKVLAAQQALVEDGESLAVKVESACKTGDLNPREFKELCEQAEDVKEQIDEGPQGIPGIQGPMGPQGIQGPRGDEGPRGPRGNDGPRGLVGEDGVDGDTGLSGPAGPVGPMGPQGLKGDPGDKGEVGSAGYPNSFTYTAPNLLGEPVTYICTDPDEDRNYTCVQQ